MNKKYKRILVANRGDCAVRVIRACEEMGIEAVSIYSKSDRNAFPSRLADYSVCVGDSDHKSSYLNAYNILAIATNYKVDAIHPGIGYFAENSDFAELCEKISIDYIGPHSKIIDLMGNKIQAKKIAKECNVPVLGEDCKEIDTLEDSLEYIKQLGYPIILKAAQGGGGKGIRVVYKEEDLSHLFSICKKETERAFGKSTIFVEKFISKAKHVEIQMLADKYGNVIHLGDRECSIQINNQKLIEETRCNTISEELRSKLYQDSIKICKKIGYVGVGTIEYLVTEDETYYFMEMNTRLQVEHTITELITGIDLVKEQIRIAQGEMLQYSQEDIAFRGYALQCRILAEYYNGNFVFDFGQITKFNLPGGFGVRVDSGYEDNNVVTPYYDSLLCKISCYGRNKQEAVNTMLRCLKELQVEGVRTNKELLKAILRDPGFLNGDYTTRFVENKLVAANLFPATI